MLNHSGVLHRAVEFPQPTGLECQTSFISCWVFIVSFSVMGISLCFFFILFISWFSLRAKSCGSRFRLSGILWVVGLFVVLPGLTRLFFVLSNSLDVSKRWQVLNLLLLCYERVHWGIKLRVIVMEPRMGMRIWSWWWWTGWRGQDGSRYRCQSRRCYATFHHPPFGRGAIKKNNGQYNDIPPLASWGTKIRRQNNW